MFNPQTAPFYFRFVREFGATAASLAELSEIPVRDAAEIEAAIAAFALDPGGGVIVGPDPFTNTQRKLIMALMESDRQACLRRHARRCGRRACRHRRSSSPAGPHRRGKCF
jgi:hypothetical protein